MLLNSNQRGALRWFFRLMWILSYDHQPKVGVKLYKAAK